MGPLNAAAVTLLVAGAVLLERAGRVPPLGRSRSVSFPAAVVAASLGCTGITVVEAF